MDRTKRGGRPLQSKVCIINDFLVRSKANNCTKTNQKIHSTLIYTVPHQGLVREETERLHSGRIRFRRRREIQFRSHRSRCGG